MHRRRKAQGLVEFAFVLPILVAILLSIIDISFGFYQFLTLSNAVRVAARRGAVGESNARIMAVVRSMFSGFTLADSAFTITVTDATGANTGDNTLRTTGVGLRLSVQVAHQLQWLTAVGNILENRQVNAQGQATTQVPVIVRPICQQQID